METLGRRLASLRKNRGLTQGQLAQRLGLAQSTIASWETGKREPDPGTILKLASFFDTTTDFLLGRAVEIDSGFDGIGYAIREERNEHGLTQRELANHIGVSQRQISQFENGILPVPSDVLRKIADVFGMSLLAFLNRHDLYDEYIPHHFDGDVDAYAAFKKAEKEDAQNEGRHSDELSSKEERDIAKELERMMESLDSDKALAFDGEPLTDEDRELLRASLEHSLRTARIVAKKKFTPKKYKK
ncbi:helix-turn-helix domain-containing protein [Alicyclobacillus fastidiosus]|uniref:Helix-turn-helix domain-containing protein n=1 Tax=Alicyclobacillus fastidiosus TaxID=392011 RepID=A0ABV5AKJ1_9BACL|nr:helix-turn-helix domain-containing protein [Alicyclobacillus fastidiosus]WEH08215.1 helix-turn-helix domain-containing protein [Alicyclobacillus fastidiosus]